MITLELSGKDLTNIASISSYDRINRAIPLTIRISIFFMVPKHEERIRLGLLSLDDLS